MLASGRIEMETLRQPVPLAQAWFYSLEGQVAYYAGEYDRCITLCQFGLGVLEAFTHKWSQEDRVRQAQIRYELHRRLMEAHACRGDLRRSLSHFDSALTAAIRMDNRRYLRALNLCLMKLLLYRGQLAPALRLAETERQHLPVIRNAWVKGTRELLLTDIYLSWSQPEQATSHLELARAALEPVEMRWLQPSVDLRAARLQFQHGARGNSAGLFAAVVAEAERVNTLDVAAFAQFHLTAVMLSTPGTEPEHSLVQARKLIVLAERTGVGYLRALAHFAQDCALSRLQPAGAGHTSGVRGEITEGSIAVPEVLAFMLLHRTEMARDVLPVAPAVRLEARRRDLRQAAEALLPTDLVGTRHAVAVELAKLGDHELATHLDSSARAPSLDQGALLSACGALEQAMQTLRPGETPVYQYTEKDANIHDQRMRQTGA